jgi:hypothetical protein
LQRGFQFVTVSQLLALRPTAATVHNTVPQPTDTLPATMGEP